MKEPIVYSYVSPLDNHPLPDTLIFQSTPDYFGLDCVRDRWAFTDSAGNRNAFLLDSKGEEAVRYRDEREAVLWVAAGIKPGSTLDKVLKKYEEDIERRKKERAKKKRSKK